MFSAELVSLFIGFLWLGSDAFAAANTVTLTVSSSTLSIDLAPDEAAGTFAKSNNLNISVALSGVGGYALGIKAGTTGVNASRLINATDNTKYFNSISSAISENDFSSSNNTQYNNAWGYKPSKYNSLANTNYLPAPNTEGDIIEQTLGENDTGSYTMSIGARADLDTTIGTYNGAFVITAVANLTCNPNATTIGDALCMQDLSGTYSADIIASMEEDAQYQLYDNRDWKQYFIAKTKDNKVWMTQNLDLDLRTQGGEAITFTHEDTDLGWTNLDPNATYEVIDGVDYYYGIASVMDGGETYLYTSSNGETTTYTSLADCEANHNDGTCPHYHVGNYYAWSAAVATDSVPSYNTTMPDSICPAGWRLSWSNDYYSSLLFEKIATAYIDPVSGIFSTDKQSYIPNNADGYTKIRRNPMYMVAAGSLKEGNLSEPSDIGSKGYFWEPSIATGAYGSRAIASVSFDDAIPYTYLNDLFKINDRKPAGTSVRCLARQADTGSTTVVFDKNASDATGTMGNEVYSANTGNTLPSNGFSRSGYAFGGWNTEPDGSGDSYADASYYYTKSGPTNQNVTLYAQWRDYYTITFNLGANVNSIRFNGNTYTNGQTVQVLGGRSYTIGGDYPTKYGFNSWSATAGTFANTSAATTDYTVAGNATITLTGKEATVDITTFSPAFTPISSTCIDDPVEPELVYDPRDNEAYYVARLCDGKYWMLDNLRLDLTDSSVINSLSSSNTDADDTTLSYLKNGGGTTSNKYPTAGLSGSQWTSSYSYSAPMLNSSYKDDYSPLMYENGAGSGKVGTYYNFCAASAGSYCWGSNTGTSGSPSSKPTDSYSDISGDICPAGWHIPTSYSDMGYEYLSSFYYDYPSDNVSGLNPLAYPALSVTLTSYLVNGAQTYYGSLSTYWSSRWANTSSFVSSSGSNFGRSLGLPIRCVLIGETTITFDKNAGDAIGAMNSQTVVGGETASLLSNGFSRSCYVVIWWSSWVDGSGTSYADGATYLANDGLNENVTLYAQWSETYTITFNLGSNATGIFFDGTVYTNGQTAHVIAGTYSIAGLYPTKYGLKSWSATVGTFDNDSVSATTYTVVGNATITLTGKEAVTDMTTLVVPNAPSANCKNEQITPQLVYDPRDNEAYYVAQLCDGKVWMLDNLRLDLTDSAIINSLSSSNTNASDDFIGYLKNGGGTTTNKYPTAGLTGSQWTSGNSYTAPLVNSSYRNDIAPKFYGMGSAKTGTYYNYCAVSAGSYCWTNSNSYAPTSDPTPISYRDIEGDICPAGWHLPTGPGSGLDFGDYNNIVYDMSSGGNYYRLVQDYTSAPLSGYFMNGSQTSFGTNSYFWSSSWSSYVNMYSLEVSVSGAAVSFYPSSSNARSYGYSARCILGGKTTIAFDKNASDATGTMGSQDLTGGTWVDLNANSYVRSGYAFVGWNTKPDGSGDSYDNEGRYVATDSKVESITLYAQWTRTYTVTLNVVDAASINFDGVDYTNGQSVVVLEGSVYNIHGDFGAKYGLDSWAATSGTIADDSSLFTTYVANGNATLTLIGKEADDMTTLVSSGTPSDNCKNEKVSAQPVYDPRDEEVYYVAQLCDGKVWMLDNLRLDLSNSSTLNSLSSSNTNANDTTLNYLKNGGGTSSNQYPTAAIKTSGWSNSYSVPYARADYKNDLSSVAYGVGSRKVGVYYNYCAVSAGSYCWGNGTSTTGSPSSDPNTTINPTARDIEGDICPVGWRLPTGGSYNATTGGGEYQNLYNQYSGATDTQLTAFKNALSVPYAGYLYSNSRSQFGTYDHFWSSTWSYSGSMSLIDVYNSGVSPTNYWPRTYGVTVRCVLDS